MRNPYRDIHSTCEELRKRVHVVLVRPEVGGNVGSVCRALQNMGVFGSLRIVGETGSFDLNEARKLAKHADGRLASAEFFPNLRAALVGIEGPILSLAASARVGSAHRPHPVRVRPAMERAVKKLVQGEVKDLVLVFGPESDGLLNEEIDLCDWVVTIPSSAAYRSVNLAQSVMLFSHEVNENLLLDWSEFQAGHATSKEKLVEHILKVAEASGFILPEDPHKMRPRLEEILSELPPYIKEVGTLHGLLDQVRRSILKGAPDFKGRYRYEVNQMTSGDCNGIE